LTQHRILFIITGLGTGGAENMLYRLLSTLDREQFAPSVISLTGDGPFGGKLRKAGVPVRLLGMNTRMPNPILFFKLLGWLQEIRPDIIQTWMYHADLVGGLAGRLAGIPVIWGIRNSTTDFQRTRKRTRLIIRVCAFLSHLIPVKIVSCSEKARQIHVDAGYALEKFVIIPNGFDLSHFKPEFGASKVIRRQLGIDPSVTLIGMAARFDPQKDHVTFIRAARVFHQNFPHARFLLCGEGLVWENTPLAAEIDACGLRSRFHLLGHREDMSSLFTALDLHTLSSAYGEAFPNVLGEAMACGVPCVTTDVGDAAEIVGDTGIVVPPGSPQALAQAWEQILSLSAQERVRLGERARERIRSRYQIQQVARRYESLYLKVAQINEQV